MALVGRSNVGKSSAINALVKQKGLAKVGKVPGKTQMVNFFRVTTTDPLVSQFYLVDLPGFGYAKVPKAIQRQWAPMVDGYLRSRKSLCGILLFLDVRDREGLTPELVEWLTTLPCPVEFVVTKVDKISRGNRPGSLQSLRSHNRISPEVPFYPFSARTNEGTREILEVLRVFLENHMQAKT